MPDDHYLQRDHVYLFERYFNFLTDKNEQGLIILDEKGKQFTSINFAQKINQIMTQGDSHLTFVVGGTFGLDSRVKQKANLILSFSEFTFTHEMMRPLLFEQLYRAFTIIQNKTYHY